MSEIQTFQSAHGARIFQISLELFPDFWGYAYLVLDGDLAVLIDSGSGLGESDAQLEQGLKFAGMGWQDISHVLITHGHIDHFGGLANLRAKSSAKIYVHQLDRRNLDSYEERLAVVSRRLNIFFHEAGVSALRREKLLEMYQMTKTLFRSVPVDGSYDELDMRLGSLQIRHVPGHSAGHVVIRLDDILFSGDHVLADISPHQAPERLTLNTGLGHYLDSLDALQDWAPEIRLTLGGHKAPIKNLSMRIANIKQLHQERLNKITQTLEKPHTIAEVSQLLFGEVHGYNVLLALEEAGAHVEYLYQRGLLGIANLPALESVNGDVDMPIQYVRL